MRTNRSTLDPSSRSLPSLLPWTPLRALALALAVACLALAPAGALQIDDETPINLSLADAATADVLLSFARVLGAELDLGDGLKPAVTIELEDVTVRQALDEVCALAGCSWRLTGEPARLVVRTAAQAEPISLSLADAEVAVVLRSFGAVVDAGSVRIDPAIGGTLTIELEAVPWYEAVDAVCARVGCSWHYDPAAGELSFTARPAGRTEGELDAVRLAGPVTPDEPGRAPVALALALEPPAGKAVARQARFSWAHRLAHASGDGWQAVVAWVPLGGEGDGLVVPLLVRCPEPGRPAEVHAFEPLTLPLSEPWKGRAGGALLTLAAASPQPQRPPVAAANAGCADGEPHEIRVELAGETLRLAAAGPGETLQLALPATGERPRSPPEAALVVLGREPAAGSVEVALLAPGARGGVASQRLVLTPGAIADAPLELADGRRFQLALSLAQPPPK